MYGLGYDSSTDAYKVVQLFHDYIHIFESVYTLKTDSWSFRWIADLPFDRTLVALVHKSLIDCSVGICAFDLTDEKFLEVSVPGNLKPYVCSYDLGVLGGCLSIFVMRSVFETDVWVMKEYGEIESWAKFTIYMPKFSLMEPLCSLEIDGIVLLEMFGKKLVAYNSKEATTRDVMVRGIPSAFKAGLTYVESLISPYYKGNDTRKR